jgi:hypothetical protein
MANFYCRVCWNDKGWRLPAGKTGSDGGYAGRSRFGHEEWLLNFAWTIAGYHYAFLQPVNRVRDTKAGESVNLLLWTIDPAGNRLQVGTIDDCKILTAEERIGALLEHKKRGWFRQMQQDVQAVAGKAEELEWDDLFNVRFRREDARVFDPPISFATLPGKLSRSSRYLLMEADETDLQSSGDNWLREGTTDLPDDLGSAKRGVPSGSASIDFDPQEKRLQRQLMGLLQKEFGKANVRREGGFGPAQCDLVVKDGKRTIIIELKAYAEPRRVIREALGQILEYAFFYPQTRGGNLELFIVAPAPMNESIANYMKLLRSRFALPVRYCPFTLEDPLPAIFSKHGANS